MLVEQVFQATLLDDDLLHLFLFVDVEAVQVEAIMHESYLLRVEVLRSQLVISLVLENNVRSIVILFDRLYFNSMKAKALLEVVLVVPKVLLHVEN